MRAPEGRLAATAGSTGAGDPLRRGAGRGSASPAPLAADRRPRTSRQSDSDFRVGPAWSADPVRIHFDDVPQGVLISSGMTCTVVLEAPPRLWRARSGGLSGTGAPRQAETARSERTRGETS
jgi:hypothetical protein